jgi:hypothetical protein
MKKININTTLVLTDEEYDHAVNQLARLGLIEDREDYSERKLNNMIRGEFVYGGIAELFDPAEGCTFITGINSRIPKGLNFASGLGREA